MIVHTFLAPGWKAFTIYEGGENLPHDLSWQPFRMINIEHGDEGADDALLALETCGLYLEPTDA